ncbi:MAG: Pls/PosA family non-ribosomal peptide synthetase [Hyphomicrobiaceae bacterium]|nr:Pls/PosA family non-ribosomal peptide synthetase [Hyphomicrobiaceae bacterium]
MRSCNEPAVHLAGEARPDLLRNETLVDIVQATVARTPAAPALAILGAHDGLDFRELDRRSTRIAEALAAAGVRRGDCVGLWLRRSLDVHVAMLGIVKAGAAFIPFDAEAPAARVSRCLADCRARILVTHEALATAAATLAVEALDVDVLLGGAPGITLDPPRPDDRAYIIYTSGSTGEPKGVAISHRNVCHYLRAVNEVLGIRASDVVLQQASAAFDLSIEEIFVPYLVGACQRVASELDLREIDRLSERLERDRVSVIDAVPTLLQMMDHLPTTLRLVVVGGEACPQALADRLTGAGVRLVNSYGPTETTVVATACVVEAGDTITIGRPIANTVAFVVDETLTPVGRGQTGELLIGGPGVAAGYVNRPELTAAKFLVNPFPEAALAPVLYRTGDAVRIDDAGRLEFHGRIDAQVKIRGYRIELGEIEALIACQPGMRLAAVTATAQGAGNQVLVAHVVVDSDADMAAIRQSLVAQLPDYMLPTFWHAHPDLPRLASDKIDRKALAALPLPTTASTREQELPSTVTEAHLLKAAREILGLTVVGFDADFFRELGGNSLLAARFVSELRKVPHLSGLALHDVYTARSLRKLGQMLDERARRGCNERVDLSFVPPPALRRFLCGLGQALALPFIIAIVTAQWIGLLLASIYLVRDEAPWWSEVGMLCLVYVSLNLGAKILVVALKWLVIGRTRPGVYPLWGGYYFRIWLVQRLVHLTAHKFLQGSPLMRLYLRALGAQVGRDAIIQEFEEGAIDLVRVGSRASIGSKVRLANVEVIGNEVHVGRIDIGIGATVGNAAVIAGDTVIGDHAEIGDLTAVAAGARIGPGERWDGVPARLVGHAEAWHLPPHPKLGRWARAAQGIGYFAAYNLVMMIGLLPIFPAFYLLTHLDAMAFGDRDNVVPWEWVLLLAWPAALVLVFASMLVLIIMRWVLLPGRVVPGRHSIYSGFYFRKWCVSLATEALLETLNSLYATVFMRNWYRLMGSRIGRGTEISANFNGRYDLVTLGDDNFIGDETIFGDEEVRGGWMTLEAVRTGDRCFFGNFAVVAKGAVVESDALLGVKSRLPPSLCMRSGETWFGSPAFAIPNRERVQLAAQWTYRPPAWKRAVRTVFEALHTSLPTAVLISLAYITADIIEYPINERRWPTVAAIFFAAGIVVSLAMALVSIVFKWLVMGIYRPIQRPMWSWWAMRTEAVAVLYGGLASKVMLDYVRGTPFLPWLLRLYGTRIGRGVWINCTDFTEFDCVRIGDFAAINMHAVPQTHLYEDRVMKVGRIDIGTGVTLGSGSVVLYDTVIGPWSRIDPLSVVMKGETIPASSRWSGAPCRRVAVTEPTPADLGGGNVRQACDEQASVA